MVHPSLPPFPKQKNNQKPPSSEGGLFYPVTIPSSVGRGLAPAAANSRTQRLIKLSTTHCLLVLADRMILSLRRESIQRAAGKRFVDFPDSSHDQKGKCTNISPVKHHPHFPLWNPHLPVCHPILWNSNTHTKTETLCYPSKVRRWGTQGRGGLCAGAHRSAPLLCRILWVLSWRRKKVPPRRDR